ncbi:MAG TPA: RDD family protein [Pyrinomonadaceae bacterium]|nr:RDD family protein [Pyrinomonadaceae bacterium]
MTICTTCGAENADGVRFCVKCGTALVTAPPPGSWQQPSGNLGAQGGGSAGWGSSQSGGLNNPSGGFGTPGYTPPAAPLSPQGYGYGQPATTTGPGGMPYAEWVDRALAALIDGGLVMAGVIILYIIIGIIGGLGSAALGSISEDLGGLVGSASCCVFFVLPPLAAFIVGLYNKVYLISQRGYSIGQGVMNLKVVMGDGGPVQLGTAILRLLVQMGLGVIPFVGFILAILNLLWPLWDPQKQTLHDKAVGTFVIKRG